MDAKVVADRVCKRFGDAQDLIAPMSRLKTIIAEEIEKAQKSEKVKTRGEVVAEKMFYLYNGLSTVHVMFGDGTELVPGNLSRAKQSLADLIDAERASAVSEYRDRVQGIIQGSRLRGDHYLWTAAIDFVLEVLKVQADKLGNQAAADVVRE